MYANKDGMAGSSTAAAAADADGDATRWAVSFCKQDDQYSYFYANAIYLCQIQIPPPPFLATAAFSQLFYTFSCPILRICMYPSHYYVCCCHFRCIALLCFAFFMVSCLRGGWLFFLLILDKSMNE